MVGAGVLVPILAVFLPNPLRRAVAALRRGHGAAFGHLWAPGALLGGWEKQDGRRRLWGQNKALDDLSRRSRLHPCRKDVADTPGGRAGGGWMRQASGQLFFFGNAASCPLCCPGRTMLPLVCCLQQCPCSSSWVLGHGDTGANIREGWRAGIWVLLAPGAGSRGCGQHPLAPKGPRRGGCFSRDEAPGVMTSVFAACWLVPAQFPPSSREMSRPRGSRCLLSGLKDEKPS